MPPRRTALVALPLALAMSCGPAADHQAPIQARSVPPTLATVTVDGRTLSLDGLPTVAAALRRSTTRVEGGRLLSVVTRHVLGTDYRPGTVLVNGVPAPTSTPLRAGDAVVVRRGRDAVEPTRVSLEPVPPLTGAGLYVGGRPGRARVVRGVVSHERVSRTVLRQPVLGHLPTPGAVALTFDDGPDPTWTPQVLALLAKVHVRATFCLIGRQAARYPTLVRAIVAGGHTLCNHSWDHDEQLPHRTADRIRTEMTRAQATITAASGGIAPRLFRAPGGAWSPQVEAIAASLHLTPLKWTVDPRDWSRPGAAAIVGVTIAQLRPGGVLLLHDGGGDRSQTRAALVTLLTLLPRLGYTYAVPQP